MLSAFVNSVKIPELRQRILFTVGLLFVSRLLAYVPLPGVNASQLREAIANMQQSAGGSFGMLFDMFSGGALSNFAIGALGVLPYISASIILQLMTAVVPQLGRLVREGDTGRQKIIQYTRYFTVLLCVIQGFVLAKAAQNPAAFGLDRPIVDPANGGLGFELMAVLCMTTGTMVLMWLGEQITERGIGNGMSLIISAGIVASLPSAVSALAQKFRPVDPGADAQFNVFHLVFLVGMLLLVIATVTAVTQAQRKIPVQYAKRVIGRKQYGGQSTYMPLKVNYSGVMPIIFSSAILMFPGKIFSMLPGDFFKVTLAQAFQIGAPLYTLCDAILILFFSYFWVATQFNPPQIADDLKKYGGYVPGIRPGKPTAEFLDRTMTRITLVGALFLALIAVLPSIVANRLGIPWIVAQFFGGTSLLITVGVMLDTMRQIESHLVTRYYDGFLTKGRVRGRS